VISAEDQAHQMGDAWDRTPHERELVTQFVIHSGDDRVQRFSLGAHPPNLTAEDVERIHKLWGEAVKTLGPNVHHRDVVVAALDSLEGEFHSNRSKAIARFRSS
jgi:hypothetical protein